MQNIRILRHQEDKKLMPELSATRFILKKIPLHDLKKLTKFHRLIYKRELDDIKCKKRTRYKCKTRKLERKRRAENRDINKKEENSESLQQKTKGLNFSCAPKNDEKLKTGEKLID